MKKYSNVFMTVNRLPNKNVAYSNCNNNELYHSFIHIRVYAYIEWIGLKTIYKPKIVLIRY